MTGSPSPTWRTTSNQLPGIRDRIFGVLQAPESFPSWTSPVRRVGQFGEPRQPAFVLVRLLNYASPSSREHAALAPRPRGERQPREEVSDRLGSPAATPAAAWNVLPRPSQKGKPCAPLSAITSVPRSRWAATSRRIECTAVRVAVCRFAWPRPLHRNRRPPRRVISTTGLEAEPLPDTPLHCHRPTPPLVMSNEQDGRGGAVSGSVARCQVQNESDEPLLLKILV